MTYPSITCLKTKRFLAGHPWIYSNEIAMDEAAKSIQKGNIIYINDSKGRTLATGYFNRNSLIAVRVLAYNQVEIDSFWVEARLKSALILRGSTITVPFYRLIHSESDGLPGFIIDRFGDFFVIQVNTAGAENLLPHVVEGLQKLCAPKKIIIKRDQGIRSLEGLEVTHGQESLLVEGIEGPIKFKADIGAGQKTGWFYDQRDNRALLAQFAHGKEILDCFSFTGSFGLYAAKAGASRVVCVDRSKPALDVASENAALNNVTIETICGEAFDVLPSMSAASFDIVVIDPPAFAKSRKDIESAKRGYIKLVKMAAPLVRENGFLLFTSCSHHIDLLTLHECLAQGICTRRARIVKNLSAGMDHPIHPYLPESSYLKGFLVQLY